MSLGLVVNQSNPTKRRSDGQFVADLASLFERRRIALGDAHVCEQLEILFTTSDAFRSQLFTLCTAISHMSEADLSGEELLELVARALGSESGSIPESLRARFLAGLHAWSNRSLSGEDVWPPRKRPVGGVTESSPLSTWAPPAAPHAKPQEPAATREAPAARPAGVPTLQEALELARVRGGDRPLRPEPDIADSASPTGVDRPLPEHAPVAGASLPADPNSATLEELNTLMAQIEERMKRLRPQLVESGSAVVPPQPVQPLPMQPQPVQLIELQPMGPQVLTAEDREAAFLKRHPYLLNDRPRTPWRIEDAEEVLPAVPRQAATSALAPREPTAELLLVPRNVVEIEEPVPPPSQIPDMQRLKTYLAIAVLAGIALVATPISGVIAYRYLHPLYIYQEPAPPPPAQPVDPAAADKTAGKPAKAARTARKPQSARRRPPVAVWPPEPQQ